jgi:hypothetical protein
MILERMFRSPSLTVLLTAASVSAKRQRARIVTS